MLRDLLRLGRAAGSGGPGGAAAAMDDGGSGPAAALSGSGAPCASAEQQASCLITSCTRKQEKRKAEACGQAAGAPQGGQQQLMKRTKGGPAGAGSGQLQQQQAACPSDTSIDDQENTDHQQQAVLQAQASGGGGSQQHGPPAVVVRAACSTLGNMLAPLSAWALHGTGHEQQHAAAAQHARQHDEALATLQEAGALPGGDAADDAAVWSDENAACCSEGAALTAPSTSSAPTVSAPSSVTGGTGASLHSALPAQQQVAMVQHAAGAYSAAGAGCGAVTSGGNTADDTDDVEWDEDDFDPFLFIGSLGPVERYVLPGRQPLLPRQTRACKQQKTLVLDLDETLVHSTLEAAGAAHADFSFPVTFGGNEHMVHVRTRPHMHAFLERCAQLFEVVVFTASQKVYAEKLLNILDPARVLIRHRIYRDSCVLVDGNYLKDLSVLGRDLSRCAIVDNSPQAFAFQLSNGIPIESWYDDPEDRELLELLPFLEGLATAGVPDVRPAITARFNLGAKVAEAGSRLAAAAAAAAAQQQQHAVALLPFLPGMAAQMMLQHSHQQQAQEQAA